MKGLKLVLLIIILMSSGCDTYRGPNLVNGSDRQLTVKIKINNKDESIRLESGQKIILGGAKGGIYPEISEIMICDQTDIQLAVMHFDELENEFIITNDTLNKWETQRDIIPTNRIR